MRIWKAIFVLVLLFFGFLTVAFVKEARQGGKENLGEPEETPIERAVEDVFNALGLGSSLYADEAQGPSAESPADGPVTETLSVSAAEEEEAKGDAPASSAGLNTLWVLIATFLVFFMQLGFMLVEAGFSRSKNAVNIMMKNVIDFAVGSLAFFAVGFGLMWGLDKCAFCGTRFFLPTSADVFAVNPELGWTFFLFQSVFCATSATIVSGAMAERTKFTSYLVYSLVISALIYPIFGAWTWGGGWLSKLGFHDFAGSTVVHSVGGWLALTGAMTLGPRIGKYSPDGRVNAIPGHHILMGALGVLFLWFGWFGFNPGSTLSVTPSIGYIAVTTNLAAAAGAVSAMVLASIIYGTSDATMTLNGILAGLVAITAGCDVVSPLGAILIGAAAGCLVIGSLLFIDRVLKIDDPVGAISVHAVCGTFGTLCVGLFAADGTGLFYGGGTKFLQIQLLGAGTALLWALGFGFVLFQVIKRTIGLRVSRHEELRGLDIEEHGMQAYPNFDTWTTV